MSALTLTPGITSLLHFWGTIQAGVRARIGVTNLRTMLTTLGVWTAMGVDEPAWTDFQKVYALAMESRQANAVLNAATDTMALSDAMIGTSPNARTLAARNVTPAYIVRAQYSAVTGEVATTGWMSINWPDRLPPLVGTLVSGVLTTLAEIAGLATTSPTAPKGTTVTLLAMQITAI